MEPIRGVRASVILNTWPTLFKYVRYNFAWISVLRIHLLQKQICYRKVAYTHYISPLFCKKGAPHKITILQEKQEGGSVLHMTNALRCRVPPPILIILEDGVVIFLHIIEDH
jgi:hypothetical protein